MRNLPRPGRPLAACLIAASLLTMASCANKPAAVSALAPERMAQIVIGRSTRAEVLQALGPPGQTTQSLSGESWLYSAKPGGDDTAGLRSGASSAAGVVGAFVPYVGLVGSGLGLVSLATNRDDPVTTHLAVSFRADGVVQDCLYSTTAPPTAAAVPIGCTKPHT